MTAIKVKETKLFVISWSKSLVAQISPDLSSLFLEKHTRSIISISHVCFPSHGMQPGSNYIFRYIRCFTKFTKQYFVFRNTFFVS